jgi:hypothetical protein
VSYPPNTPSGNSGHSDYPYPSAYPPQPSYPPQQPSYPPQQPSYAPQEPTYPPQQPAYPPQQPSYPAQQPDYPRAPASGGPAMGSSRVYQSTRPISVGGVPGDTALPQYGPPMSGAPTGPIYEPGPPGPGVPGRRRPGVPLLAALLVLLLLVGGVMTALYLTKNGELGDTKQDLTAQQAKVKDLEQQLQKTKDDLADARQDLTGTQNAQKETQRQKQVISKCLNLIAQMGRAAQRGDQTAYNKAARDADKTCTEAEKYLD